MRPTAEQLDILYAYSVDHGADWKECLIRDWMTGKDVTYPSGHYLRQLRNQFGPKWFGSFHFTKGPWSQMFFEEVFEHYVIAALWSSNDESDESGGEPMDANYDATALSITTTADMREMVEGKSDRREDSGQRRLARGR